MDKIIYLYIYLYPTALFFLMLPLNFISPQINSTFIGQALIYEVSVFCLINRLKNRKPRYILLSIILGAITVYSFSADWFLLTKVVLGAIMGYLLTKVKTTKNRIIGAVILFIVLILVHFLMNSLFVNYIRS